MRSPRWFAKRSVWVPTWSGWLVVLIVCVAAALGVGRWIHPFLSPDQPVGRGILVVEGWLGEQGLLQAIDQYRHGDYSLLVTTGGPITDAWAGAEPFEKYADRAAQFFRDHGIEASDVVAVSSKGRLRDRTWQSAISVRNWLSQSNLGIDALDVISEGPHTRRSWQLYRRAFGQQSDVAGIEIGIVSATPAAYDPTVWWRTSSGTKRVLSEAIAWAWTSCCFRAEKEIPGGGIGVVVFSQYPRADAYFRLRQYGGRPFQIAPHPDGEILCRGERDSGSVLQLNRWYHFRIQAWNGAAGTHVRAKVWAERESEPSDWSIDCVDDQRSFQSGCPGLWSTGPGIKLWDDLRVSPLRTVDARASDPARVDSTDGADSYFEDFERYSDAEDPEAWFDTGPSNSLEQRQALFKTFALPSGGIAFGTAAIESNIHSHLLIDDSVNWDSYEFSGVMATADRLDRIGPHRP